MTLCDVPVDELRKQSYQDLLTHWRFAGAGDPCFQQDTGRWDHYKKAMAEARAALNEFAPGHAAGVSKKVGWKERR